MNKKAELTVVKLVGILLIAIFLIMILPFFGTSFSSLAKTALGLSEKIEIVNYTEKNNEAKLAFSDLIDDIKECEKDVNNNCACDASLSKFYKTHKLEFDDTNGTLVNVKEGNEITISKKNIKVNCFFKNNKFDIEERDIIEIYFDKIYHGKESPYILNKKGFMFVIDSYFVFEHEFILYKKDNKICWLTSEVKNVENINYCSGIGETSGIGRDY